MRSGAGLAWPAGHRGMRADMLGAGLGGVTNPLVAVEGTDSPAYWQLDITTANTATVYNYERNLLRSSGTVAANFGGGRILDLENASGTIGSTGLAFREEISWTTATAAAETSQWTLKLASAGASVTALTATANQLTVPKGTSVAAPGLLFTGSTHGLYHASGVTYFVTTAGTYAFAIDGTTFGVTATSGFECSTGMLRITRAGDTLKMYNAANALLFTMDGAASKFGWFGAAAAPVVQQGGTGETVGFTAGAGAAVKDDSTFTGNVGATAYRVSDVVKALKNYGFLVA